MPEFSGAVCTRLVAVKHHGELGVGACYIELDDIWHQFVIDTGMLCWEEGLAPQPKDDLWTAHDEYVDLRARYALEGPVGLIEMADRVLTLPIGDTVLRFVYTAEEDTLIEVVENG